MAFDQPDFVARRPRYDAAEEQAAEVTVRRLAVETADRVEAELVNISRDGFQIQTSVPLAAKEVIVLELRHPQSGLEFSLPGTICWQAPQDDSTWLHGCQSARPLDWETLGELFLNKILATGL